MLHTSYSLKKKGITEHALKKFIPLKGKIFPERQLAAAFKKTYPALSFYPNLRLTFKFNYS
jgi:hypothetical protein